MKSGCKSQKVQQGRSVSLPILTNTPASGELIARSERSKWRALALVTLTLLMVAHVIQWRISGRTISPIEPSETMYTLQQGAINAGFIFFSLAILGTLIFGRFVCGWGCHIVALQDFCSWLLKKIGMTPKPFRSRLLLFVPLIAALYMFVWPTVYRFFSKPANEPLIPQFTNHLVTTEFWATFPTVAVAIPFLFICGFVTVYFLGSKGFCAYGCPYGGIFVLADKVAPGKIRVTDDCNQCGHCTATCMANVQVHAEVAKYGMVIDPGCMKHMDCISVCPNDALYFGFGKPTILANADRGMGMADPQPVSKPQRYQLTWPEEIFAAAVFFASYMAIWDVYQLVPMLMALGIAAVTTFLAVKTLKILRSRDSAFYHFSLRAAGKTQRAGWIFLAFAFLWIGINAHSGFVRFHERAGAIAYESINIPDELALAQPDPRQWLNATDQKAIADGKQHFYSAFDGGFIVNTTLLPKLAWLEYLSGNPDQAINLLANVANRQDGQPQALSLYYRGAILNRLGRPDEALPSLDRSLIASPALITAREEKGEALWRLGRRHEAVQTWGEALRTNPNMPIAANLLSGAASQMNQPQASAAFDQQSEKLAPDDPYFHWMLGLRLQNLGMYELAEKHFEKAGQLNPLFGSRPR